MLLEEDNYLENPLTGVIKPSSQNKLFRERAYKINFTLKNQSTKVKGRLYKDLTTVFEDSEIIFNWTNYKDLIG